MQRLSFSPGLFFAGKAERARAGYPPRLLVARRLCAPRFFLCLSRARGAGDIAPTYDEDSTLLPVW